MEHALSATTVARRRLAVVVALSILACLVAVTANATPAGAGPLDSNVVGGRQAEYGEFKFQVALLNLQFGDNDYDRQYCGGSLIAESYVLTVGHCVDFVDINDLRVVVNRTVLSADGGVVRRATQIYIHPHYNPDLLVNDVAVIRLNQPIPHIDPLKLAPTGSDAIERPGTTAMVTGWGDMNRQEPDHPVQSFFPNHLRVGWVPVVADAPCAQAYRNDGGIVPATQICAGRANRDTCQGDSGGPLFVATEAGYRQIGITSSGIGCAAAGFPGVYTQISAPKIGNFIHFVTYGTA